MAKLRINGDSSGYVDLEAPNAASSSTLDLDQVPQKNVANTFTETQQITNTTNGAYYKINAPTSGDIASGYLVYQGSTIRGGFYTNPTHGMTHISDNYHTFRNNNANRMTIDSNGYVTTPYQPAWSAGINSSQSGLLTGYNVHLNNGNHFSNGVFTCPVAGNYFISFFGMTSSAGTIDVELRINGSTSQSLVPYSSSAGFHTNAGGTTVLYLNANDTIQMHNNNTQLYGQSTGRHSGFSGYLIG